MADMERKLLAVRRVGGNYILDDELDHRVRAKIFVDHWGDFDPKGVYLRSMNAMWSNLPTIAAAGIPVDDGEGWTRPHLHVLLDMILAVMNTPVRDALRFMQAVYGEDADVMLKIFAASPVVVANQDLTMAELRRDFLNAGIGGRRIDAIHPHTRGRTAP